MDFENIGKSLFSKPGEKRILSDHVRISVKDQRNHLVRVGEFDSFDATKQDSVRKFKPVGETYEIGLLHEGGWELTFSGGKVDWNLARLMSLQEAYMNDKSDNQRPFSLNPDAFNVRNITPLYNVEHTTVYYDGSTDTYVYEDVILHNFSTKVSNDLAEVNESVKGFAPRRRMSEDTFIVDVLLFPSAQYVVQDIVTKLQQDKYRNQ